MNLVLLAAGMGSRLQPITKTIPKCMVPILGRPLLDYWFELLATNSKINKIFVNTYYLPDSVKAYVANSPYNYKTTIVEEENLLGTGGTVLSLLDQLGPDDTLVCHADNLTLFNFNDFLKCYLNRPPSCVATMMTFVTDTPESCGIIVQNEEGIVTDIHEKVTPPRGNLANAAVFIFSKDALKTINDCLEGPFSEISTDFLPLLLGKMNTFHNDIYHRDIGTIQSLEAASREFPDTYVEFKKGNNP